MRGGRSRLYIELRLGWEYDALRESQHFNSRN
jgi:hypothetical protein